MKSQRNKTIELTAEEYDKYFRECISEDSVCSENNVLDTTVCGDTFSLLGKLKSNSIDLAIVDPPYNLSKNFGEEYYKKTDDNSYLDYTEAWIRLVKPLLKETASIYVCCDWQSSVVIAPLLKKYFNLRNRITWQREKGRAANTNWKNSMEDIWFATVSDKYTFNANAVRQRRRVLAPYKTDGIARDWTETEKGKFRDTGASNFWDDISVPYWSMPENTVHPTQKPEKLIAKLILASSNEDDIVLDPFLGSGTTSVTAKKLLRHYIGIEKDKNYCAVAQKRLSLAEFDKNIQGYTNGVFWERNTMYEQIKAKNTSKNT